MLTVKEINDPSTNVSVGTVEEIQFDVDSGFALTDLGNNKVKSYSAVKNDSFGINLPYGRLQESEADYLGLIFMTLAGYNNTASISLWERMQEENGL